MDRRPDNVRVDHITQTSIQSLPPESNPLTMYGGSPISHHTKHGRLTYLQSRKRAYIHTSSLMHFLGAAPEHHAVLLMCWRLLSVSNLVIDCLALDHRPSLWPLLISCSTGIIIIIIIITPPIHTETMDKYRSAYFLLFFYGWTRVTEPLYISPHTHTLPYPRCPG